MGSGAYTIDATDLQLPTPGFPLIAARRYESTQAIDSPTGYGWTSSFAARLYYATYLLAPPDVVKREANVTMPTGDRYRFVENADGTFNPPLGRYDRLRRNVDGSFDLTLQRSMSVLHFESDGSLRRMADDYGNELVYSYDGSGRLERVADAAGSGRYLDVYWGADGRISSLVDSAGRQVRYSYNNFGMLSGVTDPLGRIVSYSYASGKYVPLLTSVRDNWNRIVSEITYDAQDRVRSYSEDGETYTYTFNYQGNRANTAKVDSKGNTWVYTHGAGGLVTKEVAPSGLATKTTTYSLDGSPSVEIDEVGVKTQQIRDANGYVLSVITDYQGPNALRYDYTYHPEFPGRVTSITARKPTGEIYTSWQSWQYEYYPAGSPSPGALHRVFRLRRDGINRDLITTMEYDTKGHLTAEIDPSGGRTDFRYNSAGDLVEVTTPANNESGNRPTKLYSYDLAGRIVGMIDEMGHNWAYEYDELDRQKGETLPSPSVGFPLAFTTETVYDQWDPEQGLLFTHSIDPNGRVTRYGGDQFGRLRVVIGALGDTTRYDYSGKVLASVTDSNGNTTSYVHDAAGRQTATIFPAGGTETYSYWPDGTIKAKTDRRGQTINYTYDPLKRLASKSYVGVGTITYSYDGQMLVQVTDTRAPSEIHTFAYDSSYRMSSSSQGTRGTVAYTYTPTDAIRSYTAAGQQVTYSYYPNQSIQSIAWTHLTGEIRFSYNLAGQTEEIAFPNGQRRKSTYDGQGRLLEILNTHPASGTIASFSYLYDFNPVTGEPDVLGQRSAVTATVPGLGLNGATTRFAYDAEYRLVRVEYPDNAPYLGSVHQWTYDAVGNRLTSTKGDTTESYTYDPGRQRLLAAGNTSFVYDPNGNVSSRSGPSGTFSFSWSHEDSLLAIEGSASAAFAYDYSGRRHSRVAAGVETRYLFDGLNPVVQIGGEPGENLFGPGIDEPLVTRRANNLYYYAVDGLGSVVLLNDDSGVAAAGVYYGAWGESFGGSGASPSSFGYTGREPDIGGLLFYRARFYDPNIGRFMSEDPIGFEGGMNLYSYVNNGPISAIDPMGLKSTYNPYRECLEKAQKRCKGTFRWVCEKFGGYHGKNLDAVVTKCLELAPKLCSVLPNREVPKGDRQQYDRRRDDFTERCKKKCPATDMTCEEWLACMAKQQP